jgi:hypothetical protein
MWAGTGKRFTAAPVSVLSRAVGTFVPVGVGVKCVCMCAQAGGCLGGWGGMIMCVSACMWHAIVSSVTRLRDAQPAAVDKQACLTAAVRS